MKLAALAVSLLAELHAARRQRRCPHKMVQMVDGPVCRKCGRAWRWA